MHTTKKYFFIFISSFLLLVSPLSYPTDILASSTTISCLEGTDNNKLRGELNRFDENISTINITDSSCDCSMLESAITINDGGILGEKCKYEFRLSPDLEGCIQKLEWLLNGTLLTNDWNGVFDVENGNHTLTLNVLLNTGQKCTVKKTIICGGCNCDYIQSGIKVSQLNLSEESCKYDLGLADELRECIKEVQWETSYGFKSTKINPGIIEMPCGTHLLKLKVVLADRTEYEFCKEITCGDCCECNEEYAKKIATDILKNQFKLVDSNECIYKIAADGLDECYEAWVDWGEGNLEKITGSNLHTYTTNGSYGLCLVIRLKDTEESCYEVCSKIEVECKKEICTCKDIETAITVTKTSASPDGCKYDFKLSEELKDCVEKLEWSLNGTTISNAFSGNLGVTSGTNILNLRVKLKNEEECEVTIPIICNYCNCDSILNDIKIIREDSCIFQIGLDEKWKECIEQIAWKTSFGFHSTELNPPPFSIPFGVHQGEVNIVLINGDTCTSNGSVSCYDCYDCDDIKSGIKVNQLTLSDEGCKYELGLAEELTECVKEVQWETSYGFSSTELNPGTIEVPCGTHTLKLRVVLADGTVCEFCREISCGECCDCKGIEASIKFNKVAENEKECIYQMGIIEELHDCIKELKWYSDAGTISTELIPNEVKIPCGVDSVYLKVALKNGTECEYAFEVDCQSCCDCDYIQSGIKVNQLTLSDEGCKYELGLAEKLKECVKEIQWETSYGFSSTELNPGTIEVPCGTHTLKLRVVLADGTVCEFCREIACGECCDCKGIEASIKFNKVAENEEGCIYQMGIIEELHDCIKELKWYSDAGTISTELIPNEVKIPCGVDSVYLKVALKNGTECEYAFEVDCQSCCDCDYIQSGIKANQLTLSDEGCKYELGLAEELKECVKEIQWETSYGFSSTELNPGTIEVPCGTHTLKLRVVLADGTVCEFCREIACGECCDCKGIEAGIKFNKVAESEEGCIYQIGIIEELHDCIDELKWYSDAGIISTELIPNEVEIPCGVDSVYLKVALKNETTCEYSFAVDCSSCCDCEDIKAGIKANPIIISNEGCKYDLGIAEELKACIREVKWETSYGFNSSDIVPGAIVMPPGTHTLKLTIVLADGTVCEFCREITCGEDCGCEKLEEGIKFGKVTDNEEGCIYQIGIIEELHDCIEELKWYTDTGLISTELIPDKVLIPCGTDSVYLKVALKNGTTCEYSFAVDCSSCCDCENIKAGIKANPIIISNEGCKYDLGIAEELKACIREVKWETSYGFNSSDIVPGAIVVPPGTHTLKLTVVLADGTVCEFCREIACGEDCGCEKLEEGIKFGKVTDNEEGCIYQMGIIEELHDCIEELKWYTDTSLISTELIPDKVEIPCGTDSVYLKVLLKNGAECEYAFEVECKSCCDCDKIEAGIKASQITFASDGCKYQLGIAEELADCIKEVKWDSDFGFSSSDLTPETVTVPCGIHTLKLQVTLNDGTVCEFCREISCGECCECNEEEAHEIATDILDNYFELVNSNSCVYKVGSPNLNSCYEAFIDWGDGSDIANTASGLFHTYTTNGTYSVCIGVRLVGKEEFCYKLCKEITTECAPSCGPANLVFSNQSISNGVYKVEKTITAEHSIIEGGITVNFKAGNTITLKSGFHVKTNATFTAQIEACEEQIRSNSKAESLIKKPKIVPTQAILNIAPNPFSHQATINYFMPFDGELQLTIHDTKGQLIKHIQTGNISKGWHQINYQPNNLSSGIYYIVSKTAQNLITKKVIIHRN